MRDHDWLQQVCPPSLRKRSQKILLTSKLLLATQTRISRFLAPEFLNNFASIFTCFSDFNRQSVKKRAQNLQGQGVVVSYSQSVLKRLANKKNLFPLLFTSTGNYRTGNSLVSCESKNRQNSDSYRIPLHTQECIHSSDAATL